MALDMKKLTRAQAERQLQMISFDFETVGARTGRLSAKDGAAVTPTTSKPDYRPFMEHANYHVRQKAWKKLGKPLPSKKPTEIKSFLDGLKYKPDLSEQLLWYALPLDETEITALRETDNAQMWEQHCARILEVRCGHFPQDFDEKIISSGLAASVEARWGAPTAGGG